MVNNDKINVLPEIKRLFQIPIHVTNTNHAVKAKIFTLGVWTIHAVNQRFSLIVGFKLKGSVAVAMSLHLLAIKGLDSANPGLHRVNHVGVKRTIVGQEVD